MSGKPKRQERESIAFGVIHRMIFSERSLMNSSSLNEKKPLDLTCLNIFDQITKSKTSDSA